MAGSRGKRIVGTILFLVAVVALLAFIFLAFANAEGLESVPGVGQFDPIAVAIAALLGLIALLLLLTLLMVRWARQEGEAEGAEMFYVPEQYRTQDAPTVPVEPMGGGVIPYDLRSVPLSLRAWGDKESRTGGVVHPFHFPRFAKRAVYANDYIPVSNGTTLKLRTLIAAPPGAFRGSFEERPRERPWSTGGAAEATPAAPAAAGSLRAVSSSTGAQSLMAEPDVYYDYPGDVHPVIDVEGIGDVYAGKLRDVGVQTTSRLCYEDAGRLARRVGVDEKSVRAWQSMAELMKVSGIGKQYAEALARAGIDGIAELKKRSAQSIADQVNDYLESLDTNVLGAKITARRIEGWQAAAKPMRRVRMKVPEA